MIFGQRHNLFGGQQPVIGGILVNGSSSGGTGSGQNGKNLEFEWQGTQLGVRQEGQTAYTYVDLKGIDGKEIELSVENNILVWRYVGETNSNELLDLSTIGGSGGGVDMSVLQPLLDGKVDKENGFGLSENNFSDSDVDKLALFEPTYQHDHGDINTLESLSMDSQGKLAFNGRVIEVDVNEIKALIDSKPSADDTVTDTKSTWSSTKIQSELDSRSALGHTHTDIEVTNLYTSIYKKTEVDNLINALSMGFSWKEPVATLQDLMALTPSKSETRIVANSDIYFYDGTQWVNIGGSSLPPLASDTTDGLMSSADKVKLDSIDTYAPSIVYSAIEPPAPVNGMIWVVA